MNNSTPHAPNSTQKMKMESLDMTQENIKKIGALFPNVITETKDENDKLIKAINFDKLKMELANEVVDNSEESYDFTWVGKNKAIVEANTPIRKTLRPIIKDEVTPTGKDNNGNPYCSSGSKDFENTENLYIEGDNLDVLKLLQESYLNSVKMIYIDPPYNTGKDFIYNDNFHTSKDEYDEESGMYDDEGNRQFVQNNGTNPRFHSDWCSMIYARLKLAKNLLTDDGVIFMSIDDNEVDNLKKICNEIFGESNFVAEFVVASNSAKNNSKYVSVSHEYMICFAKSKMNIEYEWKVKKNQADEFEKRATSLLKSGFSFDEIHQELLILSKYPRFYDFDHYTYADENGVYRTDNSGGVTNGNFDTEIIHPLTNKPCAKPNGGWRYKNSEIEKMLSENMFYFGEDETVIPQPKRYLKDYMYQVPKSTLFFDSQSTTKWLKSNNIPFDFAKSNELIKYLSSIITSDNDIILDFFSGSATTAHAVMQLNAEDGGNRKFICVQLPEITDEKSEAYKAGYKNICEIGKERIRRAGDKISEELGIRNEELKAKSLQLSLETTPHSSPLTPNSLDIGFKVFKLDTSNIKKWQPDYDDLESSLFDSIYNYVDGRSDIDVVYEIMIKYGLDLTYTVEELNVDGKTIYSIGFGMLIICLDKDLTTDIANFIVKYKKDNDIEDMRVVFKDNGFKDDSNKTNIKEILKCGNIKEFITI